MRKLNTVLLTVLVSLIAWTVSAAQEYGLASVYSSKFQGSRTASGEVFNHNQYTAAHRRLPFGSRIRITRTDNGKSVIVRVNDRGPFVSERITDMSKAAAARLGISNEQEIRVKIDEVIDPKIQEGKGDFTHKLDNSSPPYSKYPNRSVPMPDPINYVASKGIPEPSDVPREYRSNQTKNTAASSVAVKKNAPTVAVSKTTTVKKGVVPLKVKQLNNTTGYAIQVAVMTNHENLVRKVDNLNNQFQNVFVNIVKGKDGNPDYKVFLGPFENRNTAVDYLKTIKRKKIDGFVVSLK